MAVGVDDPRQTLRTAAPAQGAASSAAGSSVRGKSGSAAAGLPPIRSPTPRQERVEARAPGTALVVRLRSAQLGGEPRARRPA